MQLVEHIVRVIFIDNGNCDVKTRMVNCANTVESRALGREIAKWLAKGVGYKVESITLSMERR